MINKETIPQEIKDKALKLKGMGSPLTIDEIENLLMKTKKEATRGLKRIGKGVMK